jgi:hypothetical protein
VTEQVEHCAPSPHNMTEFRFIPARFPSLAPFSTLNVVDALRALHGSGPMSLIRWDAAVRRIEEDFDVTPMEAEVELLRALADPRGLVVGWCRRDVRMWFVSLRSPRP